MTNEKQKKTTDQYRNNWDEIFKPIADVPVGKDELTSEEAKELLEKLNIPFGR